MTLSNRERLLRRQVEEEMSKYKDDLAAGSAVDFPAYQFQRGLIAGMKRALEIQEEIERED